MKNKLSIVIIVLLIIIIIIVKSSMTSDKGINIKSGQDSPKDNIIKINDFKEYNYIHSAFTTNFQNRILIFDKTKLQLLNSNLKEDFLSNILINDYRISTNKEFIFLLDKTDKKIYKVDSKGVVVSQIVIDKNILDIFSLNNSRLLVQYSTDVNVDGILYLDENLKIINDITYPDNAINTISQNEKNGSIIVSSLIKKDTKIEGKIFFYDANLKLTMTKSFQDIVAMKIGFLKDKIVVLDPDFVYIFDDQLEKSEKFPSSDYFRDMVINSNTIYLLDGKRKVQSIDENLQMKQEFSQNSDILGLFIQNDRPLYYTDREIHYDNSVINTQNDLKKAFSLNEKGTVLIFRNGIKVILFENKS